ncbi:FAD binding domain-containing protein [Amycolatopsis sp. NPDC051903]|uniref:FAD binding domain-containing protein n=1 Tax=Amycolatopsis sp. NPDC051903 TaxID=3363936 RepID=UPI00379561E5
MKAAPFAYVRPATLDDAVAELVRSRGEGKVLAGGQSLVPILAMRLARPSTVVDISALSELDYVRREGDALVIGALVRQRTLEQHPLAAAVPLLRLALPWIGHRELRSRGTVCGSIAHADPAAELPALACCLNAELEIAGRRGRRTVTAAEFFLGAMATAIGPEDVLAAVRFPLAQPGEGFGFAEIARRHGDFALAGVATRARAGGETVLTAFGVSDRPVTRDVTGLDDEALAALARDLVDTAGDPHGSREYRRRLVAALAVREVARARRAAEGGPA